LLTVSPPEEVTLLARLADRIDVLDVHIVLLTYVADDVVLVFFLVWRGELRVEAM